MEGSAVDSSRIRTLLAAGDIHAAERLLGHAYVIAGTVVRGEGRGSRLRYPTANVAAHDPHALIPKRGVYAVRVRLEELEETVLNGVMNIGTRPTFGADGEHCEVHILDFEGDLYDRTIEVEFVERIRDEKRFPSIEALKAQITKDVHTTYNMLKA
jgi:riboflavin kinase/FMN adenylyltransferase